MRFGTRLNGARFVQMPSAGSSSSVTIFLYAVGILLYPLLNGAVHLGLFSTFTVREYRGGSSFDIADRRKMGFGF